jgi:hypothetical protein
MAIICSKSILSAGIAPADKSKKTTNQRNHVTQKDPNNTRDGEGLSSKEKQFPESNQQCNRRSLRRVNEARRVAMYPHPLRWDKL